MEESHHEKIFLNQANNQWNQNLETKVQYKMVAAEWSECSCHEGKNIYQELTAKADGLIYTMCRYQITMKTIYQQKRTKNKSFLNPLTDVAPYLMYLMYVLYLAAE